MEITPAARPSFQGCLRVLNTHRVRVRVTGHRCLPDRLLQTHSPSPTADPAGLQAGKKMETKETDSDKMTQSGICCGAGGSQLLKSSGSSAGIHFPSFRCLQTALGTALFGEYTAELSPQHLIPFTDPGMRQKGCQSGWRQIPPGQRWL